MTSPIRVSQRIADSISEDIKAGVFPPGSRLPSERDLVARYGASRMSVREALLSLRSAGVVAMHDRARAQVSAINSHTMLKPLAVTAQSLLATKTGMSDFQEARILFECGLARYAARHASPKEVERLGDSLAANRRAIGDLEQFVATDMIFHAVLAEIPQNSIFVALGHAFADWLADQRRIGMRARGAVRRAYQHHEAIFAAVETHTPEQAEQAMFEHLTFVARTYREQI